MTIWLVVSAIWIALDSSPSIETLANNLRSVERARSAFTIDGDGSFDKVYPREIFRTLAREARAKEYLLIAYGETIPANEVRSECERIDRSSRAPDLWLAIKKALHNDPRVIAATICRPLLVDRRLRKRFGSDRRKHRVALRAVKIARNRLLQGEASEGPGWFRNVRICDAEVNCHGISRRAAEPALKEFRDGDQVSSILETEQTFLVLRRTGRYNVVDGYECQKADYHSWVSAHLAEASGF